MTGTTKFFIFLLAITIAATAYGIIFSIIGYGSEQYAQVEIVRIRQQRSSRGGGEGLPRNFVTFRFPDGLQQEFNIDHLLFHTYFYSVQEGDTGALIYRSRRNIDPEQPHRGRFVRFEKD